MKNRNNLDKPRLCHVASTVPSDDTLVLLLLFAHLVKQKKQKPATHQRQMGHCSLTRGCWVGRTTVWKAVGRNARAGLCGLISTPDASLLVHTTNNSSSFSNHTTINSLNRYGLFKRVWQYIHSHCTFMHKKTRLSVLRGESQLEWTPVHLCLDIRPYLLNRAVPRLAGITVYMPLSKHRGYQ